MQYTLQELAEITASRLLGDPSYLITGVENLEAASAHEAAFLENPRYEKQFLNSQAGVIFITPAISPQPGKNYLISSHPSLAFQKVVELFHSSPKTGFEGIHPTAVIHPEASIGPETSIGPYAVIDRGVVIGSRCSVGAAVVIGAGTQVGSDCIFHAHVTIREKCVIGNRVIIQPGAVIGSCGFGYFTDSRGKHTFLKQLGKVVLEDDVEIGANTTIDRARFKETRIGRGTKVDNLVQIGHQVELGEDNLIVSQVGIAGSTKTGKHVVMGGQVGVAGHLTLADGVILAAKAGVTKSLIKPGAYSGNPASSLKDSHLQVILARNFPKFVERLKELEAKIAELEKNDRCAS